MAELKTRQNDESVEQFLESIQDPNKKEDSLTLLKMMKSITGASPKMWGGSIVGFGHFHYKYASGREGDWFITGFSPRKQYLSVYLMYGLEQEDALLQKLGKFKHGKACLNIKKLEDIDISVLEELINRTVQHHKNKGS